MNGDDTLFAHLAWRFATHPENLATEGLCYVLNRYPTAAAAFISYLRRQVGADLPTGIVFRTQAAGPDNGIPDLVGTDSTGRALVIGEAKFWAGLTENQPVTYLERLPTESPAILLFIAPAMRFTTLWPELISRCNAAGILGGAQYAPSTALRYRMIGTNHFLALVSWRGLLEVLVEALLSEGNVGASADVRQLRGLCERMDAEAFVPLRSEEMSSMIGRRTLQYCQLVSDVAARVASEGLALKEGMNTGGSMSTGSYGRYMILGGHGCFLQFNPDLWARYRSTPLWLSVKDREWKLSPAVITAMAPLEGEDPPGVIREQGGNELLVPLELPLGVDRDAVVDGLVQQLREIVALLTAQPNPAPLGLTP